MRLAVFAALAVLAGGLAATHVGARAQPRLRLVSSAPLTVRGSGFEAREAVRVRLRTAARRDFVRRVRAGPAGAFRARLGAVSVDRCTAFTVTAVGRSGRRATLRGRALPACPPP